MCEKRAAQIKQKRRLEERKKIVPIFSSSSSMHRIHHSFNSECLFLSSKEMLLLLLRIVQRDYFEPCKKLPLLEPPPSPPPMSQQLPFLKEPDPERGAFSSTNCHLELWRDVREGTSSPVSAVFPSNNPSIKTYDHPALFFTTCRLDSLSRNLNPRLL